jgi:HlyD family secretion protein
MSALLQARTLWALVLLAAMLAGCSEPPRTYQGWVEANLIFVAPDETGRLETLSVKEGEQVEAGAPLFNLENDVYTAELRLNQAQVENAKQAYDRALALLKREAGTQKSFDDAEALLRMARARLNTAQTRLDRRRVASPVSGTVQQVYFRPGEMVESGRPVLSILPPGNVKLRFFVPEAVLPRISYGETVYVHCDGCADGITARVNFISRSAEYTPPVIYSLQERAKLVFMIEALPNDPNKLRVGQPVDISLVPPGDGHTQAAAESRAPAESKAPEESTAPAAGKSKGRTGGESKLPSTKAQLGRAQTDKTQPAKSETKPTRPVLRPGGPPL